VLGGDVTGWLGLELLLDALLTERLAIFEHLECFEAQGLTLDRHIIVTAYLVKVDVLGQDCRCARMMDTVTLGRQFGLVILDSVGHASNDDIMLPLRVFSGHSVLTFSSSRKSITGLGSDVDTDKQCYNRIDEIIKR